MSQDTISVTGQKLGTAGKLGVAALALFVIGLFGLMVFRIGWVDHVENYELGYTFDARTGAVTVLPRTGYFITPPIVVKVFAIDLRPTQVCINANSRVLNCKLVKFNPAGLDVFLKLHGNGDYKVGASTDKWSDHNLTDIFTSYAYDGSGKDYPFMNVMSEVKPDKGGTDVSTP